MTLSGGENRLRYKQRNCFFLVAEFVFTQEHQECLLSMSVSGYKAHTSQLAALGQKLGGGSTREAMPGSQWEFHRACR